MSLLSRWVNMQKQSRSVLQSRALCHNRPTFSPFLSDVINKIIKFNVLTIILLLLFNFSAIIKWVSHAVGVRYCIGCRKGLVSPIYLGAKKVFSGILISKMGVRINFRIITKNPATDSRMRSLKKSISEPMGLRGSTRQPGS